MNLKWRSALLIALSSLFFLNLSDSIPVTFTDSIRSHTRPFEYDYAYWTIQALWEKTEQASIDLATYIPEQKQKEIVLDYITLVDELNRTKSQVQTIYADPSIKDPQSAASDLLATQRELQRRRSLYGPLAEAIIQKQMSTVLAEMDLTFAGQPFPPILYRVTPLPMALIVSPRSEIKQDANISLLPDLPLDDITKIEQEVESSLEVSALVVPVGGIGTYPTMVMSSTDLNWMIEVVAHEWTHNYLTLRPLGSHYDASPELRTMNETTANIAGKEIARAVLERYYPELVPPPPAEPSNQPAGQPASVSPPVFDFNKEMHVTRVTVDNLLAKGQIAQAESYMETRRQIFWEQGYQIRRLNQAYFAFYGAYADTPGGAAGEDPVGPSVTLLRQQNDSLADFLHTIAAMTSFEQLQQALAP